MIVFLKFLAAVFALLFAFVLFVTALYLADANVRASILAFLASALLAVMAHYMASKRAVEASHFPKKAEAYGILFDMIFDLFAQVKRNQQTDQKRLTKRMIEFKKQLMIWGSHETMKAFKKIEAHGDTSKVSTEQMLRDLEGLLRAARHDLGHNDSHIPDGELLAVIVNKE